MHTFKCSEDFTFHYNSDFSGTVEIRQSGEDSSFYVPGSSLLEFVANYVRNERVSALESMTAQEMVNTLTGGK